MYKINPNLVAEILDEAEAKRNEGIVSAASADFIRDVEVTKSATWSALLGDEALKLHNRLMFLHKHPRLLRALGGSATKVNGLWDGTDYYSRETPVLFESEAEPVGYSKVRAGYIFSTGNPDLGSAYALTKEVMVERVITEETSGTNRRTLLYGVEFNPNSGKLEHVRGAGFGLRPYGQLEPSELPEAETIEAISLLRVAHLSLNH